MRLTLLDKIWARHCVMARDDGQALLYIDKHLVQDGSAPAFEMLRPGRPLAEAGNMFSAIWASLAAGLTSLSILTLRQSGYRFFSSGPARMEPAPGATACTDTA